MDLVRLVLKIIFQLTESGLVTLVSRPYIKVRPTSCSLMMKCFFSMCTLMLYLMIRNSLYLFSCIF